MRINMSFNQVVVALLAVVAIGLSSIAQASPKIQHWQTSNGARVYFVEAPELPILDMQITFDAGAARDGKQLGLAVLTNGLLAEGAGGLSAEQISEQFDSIGARFGNDAQRDMSMLTLRSLSEKKYLDPAIKLLATILQKPEFPQAAFERERNRLLQAIKQRKQRPGKLADLSFFKAVYNDHPYGSLPSGMAETVEALTIEDLKTFYKKYFVDKNAVISIVGNFTRSQAGQLAESVIKDLPAGKRAAALPEVTALEAAATINIEHPSAQTHILVGQPGIKRGDPDYFALYVGNHILGGSGLTSRLSNEIREKRGLSYSTYSYFSPMRREGPFTIGLQTRNDAASEALSVVQEELKKFIATGPTQEELDAAKKNITGGFPLRISSNKKIIGYIGMIGFYGLPLDYLDNFNNNIEALTIKDIQDAFQRRLNPDKMVTVMVGGKSEKATDNSQEAGESSEKAEEKVEEAGEAEETAAQPVKSE